MNMNSMLCKVGLFGLFMMPVFGVPESGDPPSPSSGKPEVAPLLTEQGVEPSSRSVETAIEQPVISFPKPPSAIAIVEQGWPDKSLQEWYRAFQSEYKLVPGVTSPELIRLLILTSAIQVSLEADVALRQLKPIADYQDELASVLLSANVIKESITNNAPAGLERSYIQNPAYSLQRIQGRSAEMRVLAQRLSMMWDGLLGEMNGGSRTSNSSDSTRKISEFKLLTLPLDGTKPPSRVFAVADIQSDIYKQRLPPSMPWVHTSEWMGDGQSESIQIEKFCDLVNAVNRIRQPARDARKNDLEHLRDSVVRGESNLKTAGRLLFHVSLARALIAESSDLLVSMQMLHSIRAFTAYRINHAMQLQNAMKQAVHTMEMEKDRTPDLVLLTSLRDSMLAVERGLESLNQIEKRAVRFDQSKEASKWMERVNGKGADLELMGIEQLINDKLNELRTRWVAEKRQLMLREQLGY